MTTNVGLSVSEPIESLEKVSKLNLLGGGVLLLSACWLLYKQNDDKWIVPSEWIMLLIIGAILLALAGAVLRIFNGYFRYRLSKTALECDSLTPAQKKKFIELVNDADYARGIRAQARRTRPARPATTGGGK